MGEGDGISFRDLKEPFAVTRYTFYLDCGKQLHDYICLSKTQGLCCWWLYFLKPDGKMEEEINKMKLPFAARCWTESLIHCYWESKLLHLLGTVISQASMNAEHKHTCKYV